jgi:hypothetical protein
MRMVPSREGPVGLETFGWLVNSISCASVGVFWDACAELAGLLQVRAVLTAFVSPCVGEGRFTGLDFTVQMSKA